MKRLMVFGAVVLLAACGLSLADGWGFYTWSGTNALTWTCPVKGATLKQITVCTRDSTSNVTFDVMQVLSENGWTNRVIAPVALVGANTNNLATELTVPVNYGDKIVITPSPIATTTTNGYVLWYLDPGKQR